MGAKLSRDQLIGTVVGSVLGATSLGLIIWAIVDAAASESQGLLTFTETLPPRAPIVDIAIVPLSVSSSSLQATYTFERNFAEAPTVSSTTVWNPRDFSATGDAITNALTMVTSNTTAEVFAAFSAFPAFVPPDRVVPVTTVTSPAAVSCAISSTTNVMDDTPIVAFQGPTAGSVSVIKSESGFGGTSWGSVVDIGTTGSTMLSHTQVYQSRNAIGVFTLGDEGVTGFISPNGSSVYSQRVSGVPLPVQATNAVTWKMRVAPTEDRKLLAYYASATETSFVRSFDDGQSWLGPENLGTATVDGGDFVYLDDTTVLFVGPDGSADTVAYIYQDTAWTPLGNAPGQSNVTWCSLRVLDGLPCLVTATTANEIKFQRGNADGTIWSPTVTVGTASGTLERVFLAPSSTVLYAQTSTNGVFTSRNTLPDGTGAWPVPVLLGDGGPADTVAFAASEVGVAVLSGDGAAALRLNSVPLRALVRVEVEGNPL